MKLPMATFVRTSLQPSCSNFLTTSRTFIEASCYRLGRYMSVLVPKKTSAAFITVSDKVGWG